MATIRPSVIPISISGCSSLIRARRMIMSIFVFLPVYLESHGDAFPPDVGAAFKKRRPRSAQTDGLGGSHARMWPADAFDRMAAAAKPFEDGLRCTALEQQLVGCISPGAAVEQPRRVERRLNVKAKIDDPGNKRSLRLWLNLAALASIDEIRFTAPAEHSRHQGGCRLLAGLEKIRM